MQHPEPPDEDSWLSLRRAAAHRPRRIIFNNDGDDVFEAAQPTAESFLAARCTGIEGSQIDTYVYSSLSNFDSCVHDSQIAQVNRAAAQYGFTSNVLPALIEQGHDSLSLVTDFCRQNGIEVFWSARLNDMHDNWYPSTWTSFKKEHPEWRLWREGDYGRPGDGRVEPHMYFSVMDYGRQQVRDHMFAIITDVCERYDIDGIDLDFLREPAFFRPTMEGRPVEAEHFEIMTVWVRQLRHRFDEIGRRKDRPILLSVRVPNLPSACRYVGLDIERWLDEKLVDLLVPSLEFLPFSGDITEMVALGRAAGVPVYPSLGGNLGRVENWAAAATNAFTHGAAGIAAYNMFDPRFSGWNVVGEPATLREADKTYALDDRRKVFVTHGHVTDQSGLLPLTFEYGSPLQLTMPIPEDVASRKTPVNAELSLVIHGCAPGDSVSLLMNGTPLESEIGVLTQGGAPCAVGSITYVAAVDTSLLVCGDNEISIDVTPIETRAGALSLTELLLRIRRAKNH